MAVADASAHVITPVRYTRAARWLHAIVAALVGVMLVSGLVMTRASLSIEMTISLYQWHKSIGILIGVLMLWRIGLRLRRDHVPPPLGASQFATRLARVVHRALYVCLIALPVIGWLMVSAAPLGFPLLLFGLLEVPPLTLLTTLPEPERLAWYIGLKTLHAVVALTTGILVIGHVVAAWRQGRPVVQHMSVWP